MEVKEEWRPVTINGEPWPYEVSSEGRVKRSTPGPGTHVGRLLAVAEFGNGYLHVKLTQNATRKTALVHCLVAEAFIGPRPNHRVVNHMDQNRKNNKLSNLEYITQSQNCGGNIMDEEQILNLRGALDKLMEEYEVNPSTLMNVASRKSWGWL